MELFRTFCAGVATGVVMSFGMTYAGMWLLRGLIRVMKEEMGDDAND